MSRIKSTIFYFAAVSSLLVSEQINARDTFRLQSPGKVTLEYQPFSGLPSSHTFYLKLKSNKRNISQSDNHNSYRVRIRPSDSGPFEAKQGAHVLPIDLRSLGARDLRQIGNEYYQPLSPSTLYDDNMELGYEVIVRPSIFAKPGVYTLPIDIDLLESNTEQKVGETRTTNLRVQVRPKIQTNIAGTRANYEDGATFAVVDFGNLESGESERVFIQVRGNAMARLKISSDNQGRMIHQSLPDLSVNYSIKVDGQRSELRNPLILTRPVAQDLQGSAYPMEIVVGDVSTSFSGNYHDVITINVSPQ